MRQVSIKVATAGLFVLAFVGWASGLPPYVCALRALAGAAVLWVLTRVVFHFVIHALAEALAKPSSLQTKVRDHGRDHTN